MAEKIFEREEDRMAILVVSTPEKTRIGT